MKIRVTALALLLSILLISTVYAPWNSLSSGYAVTTDYHGEDVLPGTLITATAGTTDENVVNVTFKWKYPNDTVAFTDPEVPVWSNTTEYNGDLIYYANSSHIPDETGDWGVQAFFNGPGGRIHGRDNETIAIRATSFNTIPEVPVLGAAGAAIAMLLGLGVHLTRKRKHL